MEIADAVNQFHFDMTINELRLMTQSEVLPGITYNSLLYLDIIAYQKNCTVSFLAQAMHVAKSAVTFKVNELLRLGLVEKTQSAEDKRVHYLTVKPKVLAEYKIYDRALFRAEKEIKEKSLERSNVSYSSTLTSLMVYQRAYEASSKSITTSDDFLKTAIDMIK